ncbi:hypothetical protein DFH06DRAFT_316506 [Mycena polygramma]|nr:hypothetical protein DFH06DRAFT_316506 [Mycena polygramma]
MRHKMKTAEFHSSRSRLASDSDSLLVRTCRRHRADMRAMALDEAWKDGRGRRRSTRPRRVPLPALVRINRHEPAFTSIPGCTSHPDSASRCATLPPTVTKLFLPSSPPVLALVLETHPRRSVLSVLSLRMRPSRTKRELRVWTRGVGARVWQTERIYGRGHGMRGRTGVVGEAVPVAPSPHRRQYPCASHPDNAPPPAPPPSAVPCLNSTACGPLLGSTTPVSVPHLQPAFASYDAVRVDTWS